MEVCGDMTTLGIVRLITGFPTIQYRIGNPTRGLTAPVGAAS